MGRIRHYMAVGDMRALMAAGDPFRFRLPKFIRKFQPGKFIKKAIPMAASFIPGVGGLVASGAERLLGGTTSAREPEPAPEMYAPPAPPPRRYAMRPLPAFDPDEDEEFESPPEPPWMQFLRAYGFDVGDPGRAPKSKRKSAGAGPRAKAKAKKNKRRAKLKMVPPGTQPGLSLDPAELAARFAGYATKGGAKLLKGMGAGGARRRINPTNVKALRRGVRRLEAFERIVKSVHKAYPRLARATSSSSSRRRSHRSGCKCFACRRAA